MRRALAVLVAVLGGLLTLTGTAAAVVVGPDDTAHLPTRPLPGASATAVVVPDLLAWDGLTVALRATGEGDVFLGAAHPVDVASYVAGVHAFRVRGVTWEGTFTGEHQDGEAQVPAAPATSLEDVWTSYASGDAQADLVLPLTGEPTAVVAVATVAEGAEPAPSGLRLAWGARVDNAFLVAVGVAVVGAALLVAGILLGRRRRTPAVPSGAAPDVAAPDATLPEAPAPDAPADEDPDATPVRGTAVLSRGARLHGRAFAGLTVALSVSGCVALPQPVEPGEIRRVAVDADAVPAVLAAYDERSAAAARLASESHDPSGWEQTSTGAVLLSDKFRTAMTAARGEHPDPAAWTTTADVVYAPEFASYPLWFAALTTFTPQDGDDAEALTELSVLERTSVLAPWRMSTAIELTEDAPTALAPGAASTADADQQARAVEVVSAVERFVENGDGTGFDPGPLAEVRANLLDTGDVGAAELAAGPVGSADDRTGPQGSTRVVRVEGGTLVTSDLLAVQTVRARPDYTISFTDETYAQVIGMTGERDGLVRPLVLRVAVLVPDDAPPRVIGAEVTNRLP